MATLHSISLSLVVFNVLCVDDAGGALVGPSCGAPCCGAFFTVADRAVDVARDLSRASSGAQPVLHRPCTPFAASTSSV